MVIGRFDTNTGRVSAQTAAQRIQREAARRQAAIDALETGIGGVADAARIGLSARDSALNRENARVLADSEQEGRERLARTNNQARAGIARGDRRSRESIASDDRGVALQDLHQRGLLAKLQEQGLNLRSRRDAETQLQAARIRSEGSRLDNPVTKALLENAAAVVMDPASSPVDRQSAARLIQGAQQDPTGGVIDQVTSLQGLMSDLQTQAGRFGLDEVQTPLGSSPEQLLAAMILAEEQGVFDEIANLGGFNLTPLDRDNAEKFDGRVRDMGLLEFIMSGAGTVVDEDRLLRARLLKRLVDEQGAGLISRDLDPQFFESLKALGDFSSGRREPQKVQQRLGTGRRSRR